MPSKENAQMQAAVLIEPDCVEEKQRYHHQPPMKKRLVVQSGDSDDMVQALLALKDTTPSADATTSSPPVGFRPLYHPQSFGSFHSYNRRTTHKQRDLSSSNKNNNGATAISDDEHEESSSSSRGMKHGEERIAKKRQRVSPLTMPTCLSKMDPDTVMSSHHLMMPLAVLQSCNHHGGVHHKSSSDLPQFPAGIPIGRPLPPAPCLPRLRPGQKVVLS